MRSGSPIHDLELGARRRCRQGDDVWDVLIGDRRVPNVGGARPTCTRDDLSRQTYGLHAVFLEGHGEEDGDRVIPNAPERVGVLTLMERPPEVMLAGHDPDFFSHLPHRRLPSVLARLDATADGEPVGLVWGLGVVTTQEEHLPQWADGDDPCGTPLNRFHGPVSPRECRSGEETSEETRVGRWSDVAAKHAAHIAHSRTWTPIVQGSPPRCAVWSASRQMRVCSAS